MGILASRETKAKKQGLEMGQGSTFGHSPTKAAIVFWKDKKTGLIAKDDTWPLVFFDSRIYEGDLGYAGTIDTPWLHDMVATSFASPPRGNFGAVYDPPTMLLQTYCQGMDYSVSFSTRQSKLGEFVLAEVDQRGLV